jgi:hypothetical protein
MIKIECADNGWILTDETINGSKWLVVKRNDDDVINPSRETMEAFVDLLWRITDLIGPTTSRYSPQRIKISLEAGDKCENL